MHPMFQSLTGRLKTYAKLGRRAQNVRFNPSQVG